MKNILLVVVGLLGLFLFTGQAMAGQFGKNSYRFSLSVSSDDNFFQDNRTTGNSDTLISGRIGLKNTYTLGDRWDIPFSVGASLNQYTVHTTSSFGAIDGSVGIRYELSKVQDVTLSFSGNQYVRSLGGNELTNHVRLSTSYDLSKELTLRGGLSGDWYNSNAPAFTYSGGSFDAGAVYSFSRATAVSADYIGGTRNYFGGVRNDSRGEIVLGVYQTLTKDIIGIVNYFNISNTSNNATYTYSRNIFTVGVRYLF